MLTIFIKKAGSIVAWVFIVALSLYFFYQDVLPFLSGYRSKNFGTTLFNNQLWLVMHLVGGTLALLLGPTQFWSFVREKYLSFHRLAGKLYMFGMLLIGISAFRLSLFSACVPCRISMFLLTFFAVLSTWFAWRAILGRNIKVHRQMIIRSYICVIAFVTVRLNYLVPLDFLFGSIEGKTFRRVANEYFFSFVPLILAEIVMVSWPSVAYTFHAKKQSAIKTNQTGNPGL